MFKFIFKFIKVIVQLSAAALVGAGVQGQRLIFDNVGNLVVISGETINYEATDAQIVNIELFENAIRYRGLL